MNKKTVVKIILTLFVFSSQAHALDVQLFHPNFDKQGGITVQNAQTIPAGTYRPSLFMNWVRNPIEFGRTVNDQRVDTLIGWFMTTNIMFAAGIRDDLTLGIDIPLNVGNNFEGFGQFEQTSKVGLGDVILYGKYLVRALDESGPAIRPAVAILPFLSLPTGSDGVFFGNESVTGGFRAALDWKLSPRSMIYFNPGLRFRQKETIVNLSVGSEFLAGLGYRYNLWTQKKLDLMVEFTGSTTFKKFMSEEVSSPVEFLIGFQKPFLHDKLISKFGVGQGINNGYGAPDIRFFAGATYLWGDEKPREQSEKSFKDDDQDGILNKVDVCPNQPEDQDGFEDKDGCPEPDNDKDGILDSEDKCLNESEVINGVEDQDGCPDEGEVKVKIEGTKIVILEKVYFEIGKGTIQKKSESILNQIISTLKANPQIQKLRIDGYTDDRGNDVNNQKLSQLRADRVKEYLIQGGISADLLEAVGNGENDPIDANATVKGRENNRRVEFNIVTSTETDLKQKNQNHGE